MFILRVLWKLMSRHLLYHLVLPLIFGVFFEILISWCRDPAHFELREYLASGERLGLYGGVLFAYLGIALWLVRKETKPPWDYTLTDELGRTLKGATSFFATCTIPLKGWFDPYTQQYFSELVKHQLGTGGFPQERVLLFTRRGELTNAREQYLDRHYARPLAEIHKNLGIKLGFLDRAKIKEINDAVHCPKLDFALVNYADERRTVYTFDKKRDPIKLEVLTTEYDMAPYEALVARIRQVVFDQNGDLVPKHNFHNFVN